jgi:hypothetical protein
MYLPRHPATPPTKDAEVVKTSAVPPGWRSLAVLQETPALRVRDSGVAITDNSNSQFAILGLAIASRHDVCIVPTMRLVLRRFETSQDPWGGWDYNYRLGGAGHQKPAMICVGLTGLAVAHAVLAPEDQGAVRKNLQDPRIINGLVALSQYVGQPSGQWLNHPEGNRYFLWSLERVGVLYDLPTIGPNDWYRWGAEILVANQQRLGNWGISDYPLSTPIADTCMALLFLKKVNLVKDVTDKLPINPEQLARSVASKLGLPGPSVAQAPVGTAPAPAPTPVALPELSDAPTPSVPVALMPASLAAMPLEGDLDSALPGQGNRKLWAGLSLGAFVLLGSASSAFFWLHARKQQGQPKKP